MLRRIICTTPSRRAAFSAASISINSSSFLTCATRCSAATANGGMDFIYNPTEEHAMLRATIKRFADDCLEPGATQRDIDGTFDRELFLQLGTNGPLGGIFGLTLAPEDGGLGLDATASCIVHEELCRVDVGFCLAYLAHAMLFVNNFAVNANAAQKQKYLPSVLSGEKLGCMMMSEATVSATDVQGMHTNAKKVDGGYLINGSKTWITNGTVADVAIVYAKNVEKQTISTFIVERGMKGFSNGPKIDKVGNRASEMCTFYFDDVFVPEENLLAENGLLGMMRNLELERVSGAGMCCGMGDRCVETMIKYAAERKAFGQTINNFGQIQRLIAENYARMESVKALTYSVARSMALSPKGTNNRIGTDAAKLVAGSAAKKAADDAMQVLGGAGYARGFPPERLWRDAKLCQIGAGSDEAMQKNLCHDLRNAVLGKPKKN